MIKIFLVFFILTMPVKAFGNELVNNDNHQLNLFVGNFDFSDDKQKATLLGFQHQYSKDSLYVT